MNKARFLFSLFLVFYSFPANLFGQETKWGLGFNFDPRWRTPQGVKKLFDAANAKTFLLEGREVKVGVLRGRIYSGDWGFAFVYKKFNNNSLIDRSGGLVRMDDGSLRVRPDIVYLEGVSLMGIEAHKFVPFTTIKKRLQIGMNFGGGVASISGSATRRYAFVTSEFIPGPRPWDPPTIKTIWEDRVEKINGAKALLNKNISVLPLVKMQGVVAFIPSANFKIKVASGINFPGTQIAEVSFAYFF